MSADVIPMRQTFVGADVPLHMPAILRAEPGAVDAAALALAHANGELWASMTPSHRERYRQAVMVSALLVDPTDTRLLAYVIEGQMSAEFVSWPSDVRRVEMMRFAASIAEAREAVAGLRPATFQARQQLLAADQKPGAW
jgi:hypothetical protein